MRTTFEYKRSPLLEFGLAYTLFGLWGEFLLRPYVQTHLPGLTSEIQSRMVSADILTFVGLSVLVATRYRSWFSSDTYSFGSMAFTVRTVGAGVAGAICVYAAVVALIALAYWLGNETASPLQLLDTTDWRAIVVLVVATCVLGPMIEEFFYRGVVQRTLSRFLNGHSLYAASALVFTVAHAQFFGYPVSQGQMFLLGYGAAYLRSRTGGLVAPMIAHAGYNSCQWVLRSFLS